MNAAGENPESGRKTRSAVALFLVIAAIAFAALAFVVFVIARFGDFDNFFRYILQVSLQARYDRLVAGQALWPWTFWMFFWGFVALLVFVLLVVLYLTLMERKLLAWIQIRLGPNRVGPWGLLQPFADMIKLLVKEDIVPRAADKWLHLIAPLFIFVPTLLAFVAIPFAAGTVELPQQLVSPTFNSMWVERISEEDAVERGLPGPGWLETGVGIEENESAHKVWWVREELDHEPDFIPVDERGFTEGNRYRIGSYLALQYKPANPNDEPEFGVFYRLFDYGMPGRDYDVLEIDWHNSSGHDGIVELGLNGEMIDKVEAEYSEVIAHTGPDIPLEDWYDFKDQPPALYFEDLHNRFADSVAINTRDFGPASMAPAFGASEGRRTGWRDLYTPDWKNLCFIHGAVDRDSQKANLYFFPPDSDEQQQDAELDSFQTDWHAAGAAFRIQRVPGEGYFVESPVGAAGYLTNPGDSVDVTIDDKQVTLTLKDTQYYNIYVMGKDLGIGIIYILAVTSLAVLGIIMAGFGSNNKWSLYGAFRSAAQLMTYEIPMTLAVLGPVLMTGSLSTVELVEGQRTIWYVIPQFLAFYTFLVCMTSEVNRNPFDLPEAESELVAGFHTEYTGLKFGFFFLAEYANMVLAACVVSILFFGGWKGPFIIPYLGEFISTFMWFMIKILFWLAVFIWFRGTFPRFRIDQMMDYAWKVLLPIALGNVILTGYFAYSDWHFTIWRENNWRIWEQYIRPLFVNQFTNLYAIPIIVIIAILVLTDVFGLYTDRRREAMNPGTEDK